jgi:hypothetical protein
MNRLDNAILADLDANERELLAHWRWLNRHGRFEDQVDQVPGVATELIRAPRVQELDVDEAA